MPQSGLHPFPQHGYNARFPDLEKKRNFGLDKLPESRYTTQEITTKQREAHKMIKRDFLFLQIIRNMPEGSLCAMMLG